MNFLDKLKRRRNEVETCLCIGLDPDHEDVNNFMRNEIKNGGKNIIKNQQDKAMEEIDNGKEILMQYFENVSKEEEEFYFYSHFCFYIINNTHEYALMYKMNFAFYIILGFSGIRVLQNVYSYLRSKNVPTMLDAKINDIGNTLKNWRSFIFEQLKSDSCTLNIYMGPDVIKHLCYDEVKNKYFSAYVLIKTTNPGSQTFQNQMHINNKQTYQIMAEEAIKMSKELKLEQHNECVGFVIGSNCLEEMKLMRKEFPDCFILSPGIGAQSGNLHKTLEYGYHKNYERILINVGRAITKSENPKEMAQFFYNQIKGYLQSLQEINNLEKTV